MSTTIPPIEERFAQTAEIACAMQRYKLSPREQQATWLYIAGTPAHEACATLGIAYETYQSHLASTKHKIDPNADYPRSAIIMLRQLLGLPGNVRSEPHRKAA